MINKFYTDFDLERLKESGRRDDYRTSFQIDRDRIIHSSEFRRLQGKTQVFLPGEYDFYRTRLTHSIEVAQIGRSICNFLLHKENSLLGPGYFIDPDLVESACLAHDLGHPPFGHAGERSLHTLMKKYGGFEGNAQTLRILTEIFYRRENGRIGMNPSRAFLDSVLKYKSLYSQLDNPDNHFIYKDQSKYVSFVYGERKLPDEFTPGESLDNFRSIECQIMDWADDTAYAINDIVDSISGGFITIPKLLDWGRKNEKRISSNQKKYLEDIINWINSGKFKPRFGSQIGDFIRACRLKEQKTFMNDLTNRYKYKLIVDVDILEKAQFYKDISINLVFLSSQLHQMEFKGDFMIRRFFKVMEDHYVLSTNNFKLLPDFSDALIRKESDEFQRARLICDQISGMTDAFAVKTYKRLFDTDYSSLTDLV